MMLQASGSPGSHIFHALLQSNLFKATALVRQSTQAQFPEAVKVIPPRSQT